jgi:homocysteine S-methyltransferase
MSEDHTTALHQWFLGDVGALPRILLLDGGVSTHLEDTLKKEQFPSTAPVFPYRELWSSGLLLSETGRKVISTGHLDWLNAGANVISTVTYQCHYEASQWPSANGEAVLTKAIVDQMWRDAIDLAKKAGQEHAAPLSTFVVASSGCYGAALSNGAEYTGEYNLDDETALATLTDFHTQKIESALASHPDGIAIETVPSLIECQVLRSLFQREADSDARLSPVAFYVSLACRNGSQLNDGSSFEEAVRIFRDVPVTRLHAIGINCCDARYLPELVVTLVNEIAAFTPKRGIVIYPNSGECWDAVHVQWITGSGVGDDTDMAQGLMECVRLIERTWQERQSSAAPMPSILVGGCCRTRPATIATLRTLVDAHLNTL